MMRWEQKTTDASATQASSKCKPPRSRNSDMCIGGGGGGGERGGWLRREVQKLTVFLPKVNLQGQETVMCVKW